MFHATVFPVTFSFCILDKAFGATLANRRWALLLLLPAVLDGQTPAIDSALLQTVVVQSTRADAKSPVPHTNLDAEEIARRHQAQDVPYLLSDVPSLVETSDAGAGIGYTGLRIRGSDPTRINVTVNGIPLNDAESQGMYWVDLPDLAASAAEIQVQRGVGASTNGAGSFGATVNLDLSRVEPEPAAVLSSTLGSFGTQKYSAALGTGLLRGRWAFSGRWSYVGSEGYIDRASARLQSYHVSGAYVGERQSLMAHVLSGHEVTYQAWNGVAAQYIDDPALRRFNTAGTEKPGEPYDDQVDNYTQRHHFLHYKRQFERGVSLQLNGHYTRGYGYYELYEGGADFSDFNLEPWITAGGDTVGTTELVHRRWLDNHFYGATWALRWAPPVNPPRLGGAPEFLLGGAWSQYLGQHFGEVIWAQQAGSAPKDFRYYDNDADKRDANIFLKIQTPLRNGLTPFVDLQFRRVDYTFLGFDNDGRNVDQSARLNFFNPKAGLTWQFHPLYAAYAFFGTAHREPNRDDYTESSPRSRPRPERLHDLETGLKAGGGAWQFNANLFWMRYRDQLALDGHINDVGSYTRINVPDSYRAGLELEASAQVGARWTFSANAAFSRNKIREFTEYRDNWDTGEQEPVLHRNTDLAFSPAAVARAEAALRILPERYRHAFTVALSGKYVGKQYLDNTSNEQAVLPGYFLSDLRLNVDLRRIVAREINLIFSVHNLLDARFSTNGWVYRYVSQGYDARPDEPYTRLEGQGVYHQAGFFPQAGRYFMGTAALRF
jgi:iron complex outermembrane receptor protein